jgi:pyruvate-ferredoxin/flavodoxin oxidoreductase
MITSRSVQEAHDIALIAHAATLEARIPFVHFFDGFRTSAEVNKIEKLTNDDIREMIDEKFVAEHRKRALSPTIRFSAVLPESGCFLPGT